MGVYINMEMPINCAVCPFENYGDCYGGKVKAIMDIDDYVSTGKRHPRCPLVPVPPHGRLIDADALDIYRREKQAWTDYERNPDNEYIEGVKDGLHEAAKQLSIAPTIIPAEEGE